MTIQKVFYSIVQFMSVRTDMQDLLRAQLTALSRLIPLLYFILVANAWCFPSPFSARRRTG